ncbi:hypothetical protein VTK26DRAFT_2334 [Humicola hyalothermophila]
MGKKIISPYDLFATIGFGKRGVIKGSLAASIQSAYGPVSAGSAFAAFAFCRSAGAGGAAAKVLVGLIVQAVTVAVAILAAGFKLFRPLTSTLQTLFHDLPGAQAAASALGTANGSGTGTGTGTDTDTDDPWERALLHNARHVSTPLALRLLRQMGVGGSSSNSSDAKPIRLFENTCGVGVQDPLRRLLGEGGRARAEARGAGGVGRGGGD